MRSHAGALAAFLLLATALPSVAETRAAEPLAASAGPVLAQEQIEPVNINTASAEELQKVPGIGPATAARIVEWRETQGRFERLEDLLNIRGIGTQTLERLRPYLEVGDPEAEGRAG